MDLCFARQRTFFHKCHRCIYRGQAANWEPDEPTMAMIHSRAPEEAAILGVKEVELPLPRERKNAAAKGILPKAKAGKQASTKAAEA